MAERPRTRFRVRWGKISALAAVTAVLLGAAPFTASTIAARPQAALVGAAETAPGVYVGQQIALWNEGGTALPVAKVEVLRFPHVFYDPVPGEDGLAFGVVDAGAASTLGGHPPVVYSRGPSGTCAPGTARLEPHGLPTALAVFAPYPQGPDRSLIDAMSVAPELLYTLDLRLHYSDGSTQIIPVDTHSHPPKLHALAADFRALSAQCSPRGWSGFTLPAGTPYERWDLDGGRLVALDESHL